MISFTVHGVPAPAGSKRGFANRHTGRIQIVDASKRSKPWQAVVAAAAADAMDGAELLQGPLELVLRFYVPRPKGHFGARGNVRPAAPSHPAVKPDVLKLARACEDAMSGICYRDDAQIVREVLTKEYGDPARVAVGIAPISVGLEAEKEAAA